MDLSLNLIAPAQPGLQQANWLLQTPGGVNFGMGSTYDQPIWVRIRVLETPAGTVTSTPILGDTLTPPATPPGGNVALNLGNSACSAQWTNQDTSLPCPGVEGDSSGSVLLLERGQVEGGELAEAPSILILPGVSADANIQGLFPEYTVQPGDRFRAVVSCEQGATLCSILFRLAYQDRTGNSRELWSFGEFYDGHSFNLDLDLSHLAGERVRFILGVSALGSPVGDRALWVNPRVVNLILPTATPGGLLTSTPTAGLTTPTPPFVPSATAMLPTPSATPGPGGGTQDLLTYLQKFVEAVVAFFQQFFR